MDYGIAGRTAIVTGASLEGSGVVVPVEASVLNRVVSIQLQGQDQGFDPLERYVLHYIYKGEAGSTQKAVQMGAYVKSVVKSSPADAAGMVPGQFIYSITINGEERPIGSIN